MCDITRRRHDIEWYRIAGAFAIVWYHSGAVWHEVSYAGLILFFILSMYFSESSNSFVLETLTKRVSRLLVPWMSWFLIYLLFNFMAGRSLVWRNDFAGVVLVGPSIHLWFVPFLFCCLFLFEFLRRNFDIRVFTVMISFSAIFLLAFSFLWRGVSLAAGYPYAQYMHALPAVLIGIVCSCGSAFGKKYIAIFYFYAFWFL